MEAIKKVVISKGYDNIMYVSSLTVYCMWHWGESHNFRSPTLCMAAPNTSTFVSKQRVFEYVEDEFRSYYYRKKSRVLPTDGIFIGKQFKTSTTGSYLDKAFIFTSVI